MKIYSQAFLKDKIIPIGEANLSIASSAVLYGLSVYSVFPVIKGKAFRLSEHYRRLINSAKIIGIDRFQKDWDEKKFTDAVELLIESNDIAEDIVFVRASVHVDALVPGTKSKGLETSLSMFVYEAKPIVPQGGMKIKTSHWRRVPDTSIPSRAKVNGAYINSVLGKQDAIDCGYDDCLFLDSNGHVCELSAANIFIIRNGKIITPPTSSDILEGINRKVILEIADELGLESEERNIDLTEVYVSDEAFACGTSSFLAPIIGIDGREISTGEVGKITETIKEAYFAKLGISSRSA